MRTSAALMSFANQALSAKHIVRHGRELRAAAYGVLPEINHETAHLKIEATGMRIDQLKPAQERYLGSSKEGT